jgi:hypothetical protein
MLYQQLVQRRQNQQLSTIDKNSLASKLSETELETEKTSRFATKQTTEYIRNVQQVYYLERLMFC